jgi:hypothetical protein
MLGLRTPIPLLATAILLVAPAEATTSYFVGASNEAAFNTAVGGLTLLDPTMLFSASDLASGGLFNASGTGINFLGFDDFQYANNPEDFTVSSGKLTATNAGEHVTVNFPGAGIYAFGFHITVTSGTANLCVELTHGACDYNFSAGSSPGVQFFGIVSTTPITAPLDIRDQGTFFTTVLPNFEAYSSTSTSSVPEPRTMLLVGLGLAILGLARPGLQRRA